MAVVKKPSVLFVSDTKAENPYSDPSVRYRCFNLADELVRRGFRCHVVAQHDFDAQIPKQDSFDRYVFHRPRLTVPLAGFLARQKPGTAIADFDDLIFDVRHAAVTPAVRVRKQPAPEVRNFVATMAASLHLISRATVSTEPLAEHARQFRNLAISVVHNHVDPVYASIARLLRAARPQRERPFRFGYFPGTHTHDLDFAVIAASLASALRTQPAARMLVVGPVALPEALQPFADRIQRLGVVPFHALPHLMAQCQSVLAPLEQTVFTQAKSGLKYFEAALVGCEVIATPVPDVDRFVSPLLAKCRSEDDWLRALTKSDPVRDVFVEQCARELETQVRIEAAIPGWLEAVALEAA
jgi:glycosyltransferase involved in cell wall biosynthesis